MQLELSLPPGVKMLDKVTIKKMTQLEEQNEEKLLASSEKK